MSSFPSLSSDCMVCCDSCNIWFPVEVAGNRAAISSELLWFCDACKHQESIENQASITIQNKTAPKNNQDSNKKKRSESRKGIAIKEQNMNLDLNEMKAEVLSQKKHEQGKKSKANEIPMEFWQKQSNYPMNSKASTNAGQNTKIHYNGTQNANLNLSSSIGSSQTGPLVSNFLSQNFSSQNGAVSQGNWQSAQRNSRAANAQFVNQQNVLRMIPAMPRAGQNAFQSPRNQPFQQMQSLQFQANQQGIVPQQTTMQQHENLQPGADATTVMIERMDEMEKKLGITMQTLQSQLIENQIIFQECIREQLQTQATEMQNNLQQMIRNQEQIINKINQLLQQAPMYQDSLRNDLQCIQMKIAEYHGHAAGFLTAITSSQPITRYRQSANYLEQPNSFHFEERENSDEFRDLFVEMTERIEKKTMEEDLWTDFK